MTKKFDDFQSALEDLCREHGVQLSTSGYDFLQVWDLNEGDDPLYGCLLDGTKYSRSPILASYNSEE